MQLDKALAGMFDAQNTLRSKEGVSNPVLLSEQMMRLSTYVSAVEEKLAEYERDYEQQYAVSLRERMLGKGLKVTQAEREVDIELSELKGQIKYLTRLVASAWRTVGVAQSRINHLIKQAESTSI